MYQKNEYNTMTSQTGCPIREAKRSQTAGIHGPVVMQDTVLLEKINQFAREQTPPRNVHALGFGVHGLFTVTNENLDQYCLSNLFTKGKRCETFIRFSGVFTDRGEAQTIRDLRGMAVKFYTEEGNLDLLCVNTPVFNVRDLMVGPDAIHAFKKDPRSNEWNPTQTWDFIATHPESLHNALMMHTDRVGTPLSFRHQNWFVCNTYSMINAQNQRVWIRFHFISEQGWKGMTEKQAKLIAGENPTFYSHDMRTSIQGGNLPKWKLCIQVMKEEDGFKNPIAFDCTKSWSHEEFPLIELGVLEGQKWATDFFPEVEQVAFSPANVVPGISFSPDKLLQARLILYDQTQYHRLGPNFKQIPVNYPRASIVVCPVLNSAGAHQQSVKHNAGWPQYYPSLYETVQTSTIQMDPPLPSTGDVSWYSYKDEGSDDDLYKQPREFLRVLAADEKNTLIQNLGSSLFRAEERVVRAVLDHFSKIDRQFSDAVKKSIDGWLRGALKSPGSDLCKELLGELRKSSVSGEMKGTTFQEPSHRVVESMIANQPRENC